MKIRNMLPAALIAIAAVFLLSGCGALLRAIYPTDNSITVRVRMDARANPDYGYHDAVIQLYKSGAGLIAQQSVGYEYVFDGWAYYGITFKGIPDGQYSIKACFDRPHIHTFSTFGPWVTAFLDPSRIAVSLFIMMPFPNPYDSGGRSVSLQATLGDPQFQF